MKVRTRWRIGPKELAEAYRRKYVPAAVRAVEEVAAYIALNAQTDARRDARWIDRTGAARRGLTGATETLAREIVVIYLYHRAPYGKWLELANSGRYQVIMPTLHKQLPTLKQMLDRLFRG